MPLAFVYPTFCRVSLFPKFTHTWVIFFAPNLTHMDTKTLCKINVITLIKCRDAFFGAFWWLSSKVVKLVAFLRLPSKVANYIAKNHPYVGENYKPTNTKIK